MSRSRKNIQRLVGSYISDKDLNFVSVMCMRIMRVTDGGVTAAYLCNLCSLDKALISRYLQKLREKGYICRNPEDDNLARGYRMILTDKGEELVVKIDGGIRCGAKEFTKGITETEQDIFWAVAMKMGENMDRIIKESKEKGII